MRKDRGYVPQAGSFYQRAAALHWAFEQEHAARILRHFGSGNRASFPFLPAVQTTGGHILLRKRGFRADFDWPKEDYTDGEVHRAVPFAPAPCYG